MDRPGSSSVRIIDVDILRGQNKNTIKERSKLVESCLNTGIVKLVGHGVDKQSIYQLFDYATKFFDLPEEKKILESYNLGEDDGYIPFGEQFAYIGKDGLSHLLDTHQECFSIPCKHLKSGHDRKLSTSWPQYCPVLRFHASKVCEQLHELGSLALGLLLNEVALTENQVDSAKSAHAASASQLNLVHYPYVPESGICSPVLNSSTLTLTLYSTLGEIECLNSRAGLPSSELDQEFDGVYLQVGDGLCTMSQELYQPLYYRFLKDSNGAHEQFTIDYFLRIVDGKESELPIPHSHPLEAT